MTCAVTGASGGLGRRILARLAKEGIAARALVRDPSILDGVPVSRWDLDRPGDVELAGTSSVIHAAAFIPPSMESVHASQCLEQNGVATVRLLEAAIAAGVGTFVYVSAGNAYRFKDTPVREDDPLYPSERASYYLTSKIVGEVLADHAARGKIRLVILRPSAIYGTRKPGVVPLFADRLRKGETVTIQDGGRYRADLVHVDDVAWMSARAVSNVAMSGAYNVGSGRTVSMLEIAEAILRLLDRPRSLLVVEPERAGTPVLGYPALDIARARTVGFTPSSVESGLRSFLELSA